VKGLVFPQSPQYEGELNKARKMHGYGVDKLAPEWTRHVRVMYIEHGSTKSQQPMLPAAKTCR